MSQAIAAGALERDPRAFAADLIGLMTDVAEITAEETEFVSAGRLKVAARLAERKSELAGRYLAQMVRMRDRARSLLKDDPELRDLLLRQHEPLHALLQKNLTVLATAHAVSEGLVRGAAGEATRQAAPQAYGAGGYAVRPAARAAQPVAVSRTL
jgi:hypothetical protein